MTTRTLAGALLAAAAGLVGALSLAPAAPASAHPFGPPSTADVRVDGSRIELVWKAAEDDWVALGQSLGAFEDPTTGPVDVTLTGEQKLERSEAVRGYLLANLTVSQTGNACEGSLDTLDRLLERGARFTFDCPAPVTEVDVTLRTLTDLNPAYRTMLTAKAAPTQTLFTAEATTHQIRFDPSGGGMTTAVTTVAAGTGVAAIGIITFFLVRRRRGRRA
ncbi:hypothetical protein [Polymorphospora lycopeni]|uniref:LPXTG cell wall anchor domain-containing protein n=1 Tax=Polymorphospora lycopeni TaxID=3140240 RepID=A0ABV5CMK1_9ACTN